MYLVTFHWLDQQIRLARAGSPILGAKQYWIQLLCPCIPTVKEGPADSSSVLLSFIVIYLSVPCAFINLACSFSLHALTLTNCFRASFSLSFPLSNVICANFAVCMSPVLTAVESLLAASLVRRWATSCSCYCTLSCCLTSWSWFVKSSAFFLQFQCFWLFVWFLSCVHDALHWSYFM